MRRLSRTLDISMVRLHPSCDCISPPHPFCVKRPLTPPPYRGHPYFFTQWINARRHDQDWKVKSSNALFRYGHRWHPPLRRFQADLVSNGDRTDYVEHVHDLISASFKTFLKAFGRCHVWIMEELRDWRGSAVVLLSGTL